MDEFLKLAVDEAIDRIRKAYDKCEGKIFLSFSGGKDSTVVAELIKMANLPEHIPFVFADTKVELQATYNFVRNYDWDNMVHLKPRKPLAKILKENGKPAFSKIKAQSLKTYRLAKEEGVDPLERGRVQQLLGMKGRRDNLGLKFYHFLHDDLEYKVSAECCDYMKKYPFNDYKKENGMIGTIMGIRIAEGGARAIQYKSCLIEKKKRGYEGIVSIPIYDWSDELVNEFVKEYNVKLSDAYEVYGFKRTGCAGCPFSLTLEEDLPKLREYEPLKYKAVMKWFGDVYIDMNILLPEDKEYMEKYWDRQGELLRRREEMLAKYRHLRKH